MRATVAALLEQADAALFGEPTAAAGPHVAEARRWHSHGGFLRLRGVGVRPPARPHAAASASPPHSASSPPAPHASHHAVLAAVLRHAADLRVEGHAAPLVRREAAEEEAHAAEGVVKGEEEEEEEVYAAEGEVEEVLASHGASEGEAAARARLDAEKAARLAEKLGLPPRAPRLAVAAEVEAELAARCWEAVVGGAPMIAALVARARPAPRRPSRRDASPRAAPPRRASREEGEEEEEEEEEAAAAAAGRGAARREECGCRPSAGAARWASSREDEWRRWLISLAFGGANSGKPTHQIRRRCDTKC
ncbi:hypothetical protein AB1Y20_002756 [Prymnesium parvum]|uniref:Uncharacterized protein n=1 Tax=Prymnesium parvum TaxID=97485 RepID=A0AB34J9Y9_PRYPA